MYFVRGSLYYAAQFFQKLTLHYVPPQIPFNIILFIHQAHRDNGTAIVSLQTRRYNSARVAYNNNVGKALATSSAVHFYSGFTIFITCTDIFCTIGSFSGWWLLWGVSWIKK